MALNFPSSPINGQIYFDASSGNRYVYDSANTIWTYAANNSLVGSANSQILFNNEGSIDGSDALVFEANTLYPQEIVVTQNSTATYYFGNGAFLTGITAGVTDLSGANGWANSLSTIDRAIANSAANSANAYAITIGAAANATHYIYANNVANNSNAYAGTLWTNALINANNDANSANAYAGTLWTNALINSNNSANSANAYTVTVGAAGNTAAYIFANGVGNAVNAFASATYYAKSGGTVSGDVVITGNLTVSGQTTYANTGTLLVGDNIVVLNADIPGSMSPIENAGIEINRGSKSANAQILWIESANAWGFTSNSQNGVTTYFASNADIVLDRAIANGAANSANAYAVTVGAAGNTAAYVFANGTANSANAYAVTVGAAGNTAAYIFANGTANSANAYAVTVGAAANATHYIYANNVANSANSFAVTIGASSNNWANTKGVVNNTLTFTNSSIFANTLLTTSATSQILDVFSTSTWRSANYIITMNTTPSLFHTTQIVLLHDGTNAYITEYGTLFTSNNLALFDATIVSGNVRLNVVPSVAVTTINFVRTTNK
jgi:hypothetical protein